MFFLLHLLGHLLGMDFKLHQSVCVFFSGSDALDAFLKPKATLAPLVSGPRGDALDSLLAPKTTLLPRKLEALDPVVGHKEMPKMEKEKELKGGGGQVLDFWSWSLLSFSLVLG